MSSFNNKLHEVRALAQREFRTADPAEQRIDRVMDTTLATLNLALIVEYAEVIDIQPAGKFTIQCLTQAIHAFITTWVDDNVTPHCAACEQTRGMVEQGAWEDKQMGLPDDGSVKPYCCRLANLPEVTA